MSYVAAPTRYETMSFRQCGKTGLKLPALSLGFSSLALAISLNQNNDNGN